VMSTVFYYLIGIDYPLVLGILMGIADMIPYFGPYLGAIPAVLIALSISKTKVLIMIIGMVVIQQIEGSFITPFVIDKRVGLHPLITIFAVMAGTYLWGIVGAIFAVPLASVIILLAKYLFARLLANNYLRNTD
jgi:predicted PurR-regulated permease PerM